MGRVARDFSVFVNIFSKPLIVMCKFHAACSQILVKQITKFDWETAVNKQGNVLPMPLPLTVFPALRKPIVFC